MWIVHTLHRMTMKFCEVKMKGNVALYYQFHLSGGSSKSISVSNLKLLLTIGPNAGHGTDSLRNTGKVQVRPPG